MSPIIIKDGKLAYSAEYAFLLSKGEGIYLPVEILALLRMKNPNKSEVLALLNTFYHGFYFMKKKGYIDPANRLDENGEYVQEIKNAMLAASIPHVPLAITKLEIKLCETKRKERPQVIAELLAEWEKYLNGS